MKEKNNDVSLQHLDKIKHRIGYKINESPRYKPLIDDNVQYDEVPTEIYSTQDGLPVPDSAAFSSVYNESGQQEPRQEVGRTPQQPQRGVAGAIPEEERPEEEPTPDVPGEEPLPDVPGEEPVMDVPAEEPVEEEPVVDEIQNEIIKHNIAAMQSIHQQLEQLTQITSELGSKVDALNADVEEVREPTSGEKLMKQKDVSYPYYFNLNDFWSQNWFTEKRNEANEKGVRELPDGTFIADFDDLPKYSKFDVQDSFNKLT